MERCELLAEDRRKVKREDMGEWESRHIQKPEEKKKKKGPVEPEKEKDKEVDELESFFGHIYEFHFPTPVHAAFVPAELPPRYAIAFVPALSTAPPVLPVSTVLPVPVSPVTTSSVHSAISAISVSAISASNAGSDFSVVSSANFIPASVFTSSSCIGTTQ